MGSATEGSGPGIIYLSTIPDGMNVTMVDNIMKQFGKIGRIYLVPKAVKHSKYRKYEEGWVEFISKRVAKKVARVLNCTEVPATKRNPWYGELWNVRFLPDASWSDLFGADREEEEQQRSAHDRDILIAKRHARQFKTALETKNLEEKLAVKKGKRFNKRKPLELSKRQKPTEEEVIERMSRSHRTPPENCGMLNALSNQEFMNNLFAGGL
ncbi:unnamed protein product [Calicophoron daubneyi]|uniref:Activator of basal transcription 1 n=1 Tax=Calicophoron daubneyi TaxID=300641 RepID=A0AAV2T2N2_CALDB